jgi:zinc-binding alcohol dehydrogenase family protein
MKKMNAIGLQTSLPINEPESLILFEADYPIAKPHDIIVKISAVSINPVDAKVRGNSAKDTVLELPRILGYDAVGTVVELGDQVTMFNPGDRVYYAGDVSRSGSNAEFQAVDSRIVALAPANLNDTEAAALPLTAITAWEALFDRLRVTTESKNKTLLIIGGAGGVGSIAIQIAKKLTNLTVIATASRPESIEWVKQMGADFVADHYNLEASVKEQGFDNVDYIFNAADTTGHWDAMVELIAPQGMISCIVETHGNVDLGKLQSKSVGVVWEMMFTRPLYDTSDILQQHNILKEIAKMIEDARIQTTLNETLVGFNVETLKAAHQKIESGKSLGKIAIQY